MKLILTGGFLGSGKTTAIQRACNVLTSQHKKVAVITNDQGEDLVDSKFIKGFSIPVKEVTKSCFCCNYNALIENLYAFKNEINPEIIFAESVGSCADLVATIANPLNEMQPELTVNISVFVDASLLHSIITGASFFIDESVRYIFKKQMEEADILILNKIDLLNDKQLATIKKIIQQEYSGKKILMQNSLNKTDVNEWMNCFEEIPASKRTSLDIDYKIYGEGEAKLAWLDAIVNIKSQKIPAAKIAVLLAENMYQKINGRRLTIGHLKFLINDGEQQHKISYTTTMHYGNAIIFSASTKAAVLINARVQTTPEILEEIIRISIKEIALQTNGNIKIESLYAFKPGFPKPTYRMA